MNLKCNPPMKAWINHKDRVTFEEVWFRGADEVYLHVTSNNTTNLEDRQLLRLEYEVYFSFTEAEQASKNRLLNSFLGGTDDN
jgi:hypothetical protein